MKKYMTVSELEAEDQKLPIWALNGSADSEIGQAGEVHVGIPKINGSKIDPLYIPQTFLPQNLTDQIPRAQLLASSEFRNAVNNRLLSLITPEFAAAMMEEDGVEEERQRLNDMKRHVKEATAARSITQSGADVINTMEIADRTIQEEKPEPGAMTPSFTMFANALNMKSDMEVTNLIRSRGKMTRGEIDHLIKTLHDKPKTVAMLKAKIS